MATCPNCGTKVSWTKARSDGTCPDCYAKKSAAQKAPGHASDLPELAKKIILTTETAPQGLIIKERLGVISAECVFGMNIFKDIFAGARDIFGGRSKAVQNTLRDARETTLNELRKEAHACNADAVIAIDLDYSEISTAGSMLMLVASGTAVKLQSPRT